MTLVGRCAALSVAVEARRRACARRAGEQTSQQPLRSFLASETAGLLTATVEDRALTLEALRQRDDSERLAQRRRELRRR